MRNEWKRRQWRFFWSETQTFKSCRSIDYARNNKSIMCSNDLCRPIEKYIYVSEKAPICKLSRSKEPKTQQTCGYRHTRKTSRLFKWHRTGVHFCSFNNFANLGSFAKVSVPVESIIPWSQTVFSRSCDTMLSLAEPYVHIIILFLLISFTCIIYMNTIICICVHVYAYVYTYTYMW